MREEWEAEHPRKTAAPAELQFEGVRQLSHEDAGDLVDEAARVPHREADGENAHRPVAGQDRGPAVELTGEEAVNKGSDEEDEEFGEENELGRHVSLDAAGAERPAGHCNLVGRLGSLRMRRPGQTTVTQVRECEATVRCLSVRRPQSNIASTAPRRAQPGSVGTADIPMQLAGNAVANWLFVHVLLSQLGLPSARSTTPFPNAEFSWMRWPVERGPSTEIPISAFPFVVFPTTSLPVPRKR